MVHSDVVGPLPVESIGKSIFAVTFLDDHSRYAEVEPITRKSEVEEKFHAFRAKSEMYHGKKMKALISDNGGEYISNELKKSIERSGPK